MSDNSHIKEEIIQEQILLAAKQLFQVHGLRKVTMDDVAKAIGKARSSLYYYYKSKDEILEAVMDAEIREMLTAMATATKIASTTAKKIHAFYLTKLRILRDKRSFYGALDASGMDADEMTSYNKTKQAIHQRIMQEESTLLHQILSDGIAKGELRAQDQQQLETLVFVLLSSLHGFKTGNDTQQRLHLDRAGC